MAKHLDNAPPSPALPAEGREENQTDREIVASPFLKARGWSNPGPSGLKKVVTRAIVVTHAIRSCQEFPSACPPTGLCDSSINEQSPFPKEQALS